MARPPFQPTDKDRALVEQLAAFGIPVESMTRFIKDKAGKSISEKTLRKHFATELDQGELKANFKVAQTLFSKAISGDTTSMIFWLKTRARWRESPQSVELTGAGGGPVQISDTERAAKIAAILAAAQARKQQAEADGGETDSGDVSDL
jgi:hypothetical protein